MVGFGFSDVDATRMTVRTDPDDPATSIYHLLMQKEQRETLDRPVDVVTPPPTPSKRIHPPLTDTWLNIPPLTPILSTPPLETPVLSAPSFFAPTSIVSQAAATVANHFKKLRGINLLPRSQGDADYRPVIEDDCRRI
jgi:hypothetical protein